MYSRPEKSPEAGAAGLAHDEGQLLRRIVSAQDAAGKHPHRALEQGFFFGAPAGWVRHGSSWFGSELLAAFIPYEKLGRNGIRRGVESAQPVPAGRCARGGSP